MADDIPQQTPAEPVEAPAAPVQTAQTPAGHVDVINPEGEYVSIPQEQLDQALSLNYTKATPEQVQAQTNHETYGGLGQGIAATAEGAARGLVGRTITNAAEQAAGVSPASIKGREEEHPIASSVGEVGSFIGGAVLGTGEAALLGKAGEAFAGATELAKAAKAGGFVSKVAADAATGAFESVLYQADQETGNAMGDLGKTFKEDPGAAAGHAIADLGLAAIMGGTLGAGFSAAFRKLGIHPDQIEAAKFASPEGEAIEPSTQTAMQHASDTGIPAGEPSTFISGADQAKIEAGDLKTHFETNPDIPDAKKATLIEALDIRKPKANSEAIKAAREALGAPETPGMLLDSPVIQVQLDALANSPYTYSGSRIRAALDSAYDSTVNTLKSATDSEGSLSKDQVGQKLQSTLTADTREAYAPVQAAFKDVEAIHPQVPVTPADISEFKAGLNDIKEVALKGTAEGKLAQNVWKVVQNAKNADDLSTIRNMADLKKAGVGYDPLGRIKGILRDRLEEMQTSAVDKYARSFPRNDEAGAMFQASIDQLKRAQQDYKPYIRKVAELSDWLGKGKIHGTEDALNFMNDRLSASDVATKLFSASKDPQFLRFFSKEFPEQFAMIRDYQRMALRESATTGETFSPKVFFNKFDKLEPELQKALYSSDEIKKIKAADTYIRYAFPKAFNPSGTSHVGALRAAYESPKSMGLANVRDLAMETLINRTSPRFAQATALAKATVAGDKTANKAVNALFSGIKEKMPASVIPLAAHRAKLAALVDTYHADPSKMLAQNDNNPIPEYAQAFTATSGRAIQYLASIKPDTEPRNPLDPKLPPSASQNAAYNRALDVAQQPLNVIHRMQAGTLTTADMVTLRTIYPDVYKTLTQKIMTQIVDTTDKGKTIPYATRLQLSVFLGRPLDSTMTQPAMAAIQASSQTTKQAAQQPLGKPPAASSVKGLSKISTQSQTQSQSRQAARSDDKL